MTDKNINFKPIIRKNILLIGGLLKEEIDDPKLEFGFIFIFPNERGKPMTVIRQKKKNFIEISFGFKLSPEHEKKFKSLENTDKRTFIKYLQKNLFRAELDYNYNFSQQYTLALIDKIFLENDQISLNQFFRSVRKIHSNAMNIIFFIQDFFTDEFNAGDLVMK